MSLYKLNQYSDCELNKSARELSNIPKQWLSLPVLLSVASIVVAWLLGECRDEGVAINVLSSQRIVDLQVFLYTLGCLSLCAVFLRRALRAYCVRNEPPSASKSERYVASTLSALVIFVFVFDILFKRDHWPFAATAMFAKRKSTQKLYADSVVLCGVCASDPQLEFPITDNRFFAPFSSSKEFSAVAQVAAKKLGSADLGRVAALRWLARRYCEICRSSAVAAPQLSKLRWYRYNWIIDKGTFPRSVCLRKELLTEVKVDRE